MAHRGGVRSVDSTRFAMMPRADVPRSAFDVQHGHKTTFNAGLVVPIYVDEVMPGDSVRLKMNAFCRLSTPIVPLMDSLELETFFFFVPYRLLWDNWERFMGEQTSPTDTTQFLAPVTTFATGSAITTGSIPDYLGVTGSGSANQISVSAFPFRAYMRIWNEWFRDQDIQSPVTMATGDGPDDPVVLGYTLAPLSRAKRHDYFTSARPWPQKPMNIAGLPDATGMNTVGLNSGFPAFDAGGGFATQGAGVPVIGIGVDSAVADLGADLMRQSGTRTSTYGQTTNTSVEPLITRLNAGLFPDIRVLVNDIRTATLVQRMLETNARGGTRYAEIVRAHFGVVSPDARLQRPELLGGGRTMIQVNPVAQTSASGATGTTTKLGELAAIGTATASHGFSASFTEHGVILGLANVRSFLTYQQGNNRMWYRRSQFDFYWPGLAHLGEQAILKQELFADGLATDTDVFGYQERWSEYKYKPSRTSGFFRSTAATPLDMWHLGQLFAAKPSLNTAFIIDNPPVSRVLQVATNFGEDFLFDSLFDVRYVRPMPMYSIPGVGARL